VTVVEAAAPPLEPTGSRGGRRARGVLGWLGQVVSWVLILAVGAILLAAVAVPRLAGATPYTVLTGSMRPHYPPGTLLVVKPVAPQDILIGDVITFQLDSGQGTVASHRVIGISTRADGELQYLVKGDANAASDAEPVRAVQVRGRLWYAVPYLGYVNNMLTGHERQYAVWAVAAGLLGYAARMFWAGFRDRDGRTRPAGRRRAGADA
jgi:signal peptidase I